MKTILSSMAAAAVLCLASSYAASAPMCHVGDEAKVYWRGQWAPAKVERVNESRAKCYVHFQGHSSATDEWVDADRVHVEGYGREQARGYDRHQEREREAEMARRHHRFEQGDRVMVMWRGSWRPARIERVGEDKYKVMIHDGGSSNGEWVDRRDVRPR